jgi:RNA polymerase sigma factor (sigma-70 family)
MVSFQPDEDLVARILRGDEDAFSQLYDRYRLKVFSTAYRIIQNTADAQDATQDIFIKLYRSLSDYNSRKSKFSTWLYRLAANHAIDCWRARRRRLDTQSAEIFDSMGLPERPIQDAILTPFGALARKERVERITSSVNDLPELQKKVFVLRYFQDLKLEEIARIEKCSLGTVKTSLFRATHAVRRAVRRTGAMS